MHSDPTYLAFANPLDHPLHFLGLELVFVAGFVLTLRHALGRYRQGDRYHLFQWLVIFAYGIVMELIAFNFLNNYDHGQFTVQLYHHKLPFYVICLYPVFHYTGLKLAERWKLGWLAESLLAGFAICLLDMPFDIAGPDAHWWSWSSSDPNLAARWLGVPVTSYYWYLIFGAVYAALCRGSRRWVERRPLAVYVALAPLYAVAVVIVGSICFLPFHGLRALGVPDGVMVAAQLVLCAAIAWAARPAEPAPADRGLYAIPLLLAAWHLGVIVTLSARGQVERVPLKLSFAAAAALATLFILRPAPRFAPAAHSLKVKETP